MGLFVLALCLTILPLGYPQIINSDLQDAYDLSDHTDLNECNRVEWSKFVWNEKKELVKETKVLKECCLGFERASGRCVPVCKKGCDKGICLNPNECVCNEGWTGDMCEKECDDTKYGRNCEGYCSCKNLGVCNKKDGTCLCKPGFSGLLCETKCPINSFGDMCENKCRCKNGATCNSIKGTCFCPPGYIGRFCEKKCPDFSYGKDCLHDCNCEKSNTEFCSHIDGTCSCCNGFTGISCEEICPPNTWGPRCGNECDCGKNITCHHYSGECDCPPGFHGPGCHKSCPEGKYGYHCRMWCKCNKNQKCDPVTGKCVCGSGWTGQNCETAIPESVKRDTSDKATLIITGLLLLAITPFAIYFVFVKIRCFCIGHQPQINEVIDNGLLENAPTNNARTSESSIKLSDANDKPKNNDSGISVRYSTIRRNQENSNNSTQMPLPGEKPKYFGAKNNIIYQAESDNSICETEREKNHFQAADHLI